MCLLFPRGVVSSGHGARVVRATKVDDGPDKEDPPVSLPLISPFCVTAWRAPSISAFPRCRACACPLQLTSGPDLHVTPPVKPQSFPPPECLSRRPVGLAHQRAPALASRTGDTRVVHAWDPPVSHHVRSRVTTSNIGRPFSIGWQRSPDTLSLWLFCLRPLGFLRIEPVVLTLYAQAPELLQTDPTLLNNCRFGLNFVFQIPKLIYFISFAYEPQI
jgi:hypothetical protein